MIITMPSGYNYLLSLRTLTQLLLFVYLCLLSSWVTYNHLQISRYTYFRNYLYEQANHLANWFVLYTG